jgi:hypothetical protein
MGRSDDQRAGICEHYKNISQAATSIYHILASRPQGDKPFGVICSKKCPEVIDVEQMLRVTSACHSPWRSVYHDVHYVYTKEQLGRP